ncbi:hypothetical protein ACFLZ6_00235 [Nanoarchaeota archaeon]
MKKDVNFGLFVLIIATLICFAGFTAYYQATFENVSTGYKEKIDELSKVTTDLQTQKTRLNETSYELKIKVDRESELSEKYNEVKTDKETLEANNAKLTSELASTTSELNQKKSELAVAQSELSKARSDLSDAVLDASNLEDDVDDLCDTISDLGGSDSICD